MTSSKEELIQQIEVARKALNKCIDDDRQYDEIYKHSVELDSLIEQYIVAEY